MERRYIQRQIDDARREALAVRGIDPLYNSILSLAAACEMLLDYTAAPPVTSAPSQQPTQHDHTKQKRKRR